MFHVEHCKKGNDCCSANPLIIICRVKEKNLYKIQVLCYLHIFHCMQHHSDHLSYEYYTSISCHNRMPTILYWEHGLLSYYQRVGILMQYCLDTIAIQGE